MHAIAVCHGLAHFFELFFDLAQCILCAFEVESDLRCGIADGFGTHQGREAFGHLGQGIVDVRCAFGLAFFGLLARPYVFDSGGVCYLVLVSKDMRVTRPELMHQGIDDVLEVKESFFSADLCVEHHLQQYIAEFFSHGLRIARSYGVDIFCALFLEVGDERREGLLSIPWASVRRTQRRHQIQQLLDIDAGRVVRKTIVLDGRCDGVFAIFRCAHLRTCYFLVQNIGPNYLSRARRNGKATVDGRHNLWNVSLSRISFSPADTLATQTLELELNGPAQAVFGHREANLRLLADALSVEIGSRANRVMVQGDGQRVAVAINTLQQLYALAKDGYNVHGPDVVRAAEMIRTSPDVRIHEVFTDQVLHYNGQQITPKTLTQKAYIDAIRKEDLVFGIGPAGTGKSFLAVAMAVAALKRKEVKRIILTRPAVEAGENLGFLPGDLAEKVSPYLRPLYDAMQDMMDAQRFEELVARGTIEVAPLAFMRGRTLNDAFVILDEAQNTTRAQMKMFLTRIGFGSKAVVTGDLSQTDLPRGIYSGLGQAVRILNGIPSIEMVHFQSDDVVRHPMVRRIIDAYDRDEAAQRTNHRGQP